ncbi:MAG: G5 domain-containing protein [Trueperella sp.]|nr:G5 domain-containing protein [Trueperella sp.]
MSTNSGFLITEDLLNTPPKPGSRRARRAAERAQAAAERRARKEAFANADTGEIPVVAATAARSTYVKPYAEIMNDVYVKSRAAHLKPATGRRNPRFLKLSGVATVAALTAGSAFGISLEPRGPRFVDTAYAASANQELANVIVPVQLTVDGKTRQLEAHASQTYGQVIDQAGVKLGEKDEVSVPLSALVAADTEIKIVRVRVETVTEEFTEAHAVEEQKDPSLPAGRRQVVTAGVDGSGTRTYQVTYRDGEESARVVTVETLKVAPVTEVVKVGAPDTVAVPPAGPAPSPGSARAIARDMVAANGWGPEQFQCLDALWQRESGWNTYAMNRSSGAYGIPQSLPGNKMASAGADWRTNPATQITWGLGYIKGRYGSPCGAWNHSQARGWY